MKSRWLLVVALAAIGAAAYGGKVLATPAVTGYSGTTLAKATVGDLDIKSHIPAQWMAQLKTKGDSDVYVQQNTWDPSVKGCDNTCIPSTGWHTHPGPSIIIVTQGTITAYEGDDPTCTPHVYSASGTNSFVDIGGGDVHILRDESGAVAKTVAVQFVPKGADRRIDQTPGNPNCPF